MTQSTKVNPDLVEERQKVSFQVEDFTNWFHDGAEKVKQKRFYENFLASDPELQNLSEMSYMSHKEKYEESLRRTTIVLRKIKKLQSEGRGGDELYENILNGLSVSGFLKEGHPLVTHIGMFVPTLINFGTAEQNEEWVQRSWDCKVIGTYAQTELGHGTYIRGIETTAIYDTKRREFVINSPSINAYKAWPGGLAHTVNHAVVFAQLWTQGKHQGVQPFIVQLRDMETHKPMKGITIGELGPKVGFNCVNNGFLGFNQVRIPLKNMLMKNSKVLPNGDFVKVQESILTYWIMTFVRVNILRDQARLLSKAATIAMRYSIVRRQSPIDPNLPEPKIIDHVTQQLKVFPAIAKVIVFQLAARNLLKMYDEVKADIGQGNLMRLPEFHATSCCLKAVSTTESVQTVQTLRLACGGHGYLNSSGFQDCYGTAAAAQAYEGDNTIMFLQTARFLMKAWTHALEGGSMLTPTVEYLKKYTSKGVRKETWEDSPRGILRALQAASAGDIAIAFKSLEQRKKIMKREEATSRTGIELGKASEIHCQVFLLQTAIDMIEASGSKVSASVLVALRDILDLYAVDLAFRYMSSILQNVNISSSDIEQLQARLEIALTKFKTHAIGLVDGFDVPDFVLGSVLGAYDGNVYERLLEAAKKSPLNQEDVNKSFHLYLKPLMMSNL